MAKKRKAKPLHRCRCAVTNAENLLTVDEPVIGSKAVVGVIRNTTVTNCAISASGTFGLRAKTLEGKPAHFAVLDEQGNVLEEGRAVAAEAWNVCIKFYSALLFEDGKIKVLSAPPGMKVV
ncbi:MAG: hypothetical protein ACM31P_09630 [Actinomycetota bacterium]